MKVLFTACENAELFVSEKWFEGMSKSKRDRILKVRSEKDRNTAIAAHRLLCRGLISEYGFTPSEDEWREGDFGKPYLKDHKGAFFNISHSGQMVMCAIGAREVGADIQEMRPVKDTLAAYVLSDEERKAYMDSGRDEGLFYKIWTLKEAYLKFRGSGIGELGSIAAYPKDGKIVTNAAGCGFSLIEEIDGFKAAVCSEEPFEVKAEHIKICDLADI